MAYGMKFSPDGTDFFISTWVPFNYIDTFTLAAGAGNGSKSYTLAPGRSLKVLTHNLRSGVTLAAYSFSVSGNTVNWVMNTSNSPATVIVLGEA